MARSLLFAMLLLSSTSLHALPCAKSDEMEAIRVRALQTELMFAALSCSGAQSYYNRFIQSYRDELQENAEGLRAYFARVARKDPEGQMNRFVTRLANQSSTRSLHKGLDGYCSNAAQWFSDIENNHSLQEVSYRYHGEVRSCR